MFSSWGSPLPSPSAETAIEATTGMYPASASARIGPVSIFSTSPTRPSWGSATRASIIPPSTPDSPTARPPSPFSSATSRLFTSPVSTATAISRLGSSVTRSPRMNLGRTPCRCIQSETTLPPPCTTTGRAPPRWSAATSRRLVSWLPSVLPPIFTTIVPSCNSAPGSGSASGVSSRAGCPPSERRSTTIQNPTRPSFPAKIDLWATVIAMPNSVLPPRHVVLRNPRRRTVGAGSASTMPRDDAIFIPLCGPRKALVIPAKAGVTGGIYGQHYDCSRFGSLC